MNRVMEGNVTDNMKCTWEDLTERIIKLAVSETDNHNVQSMTSAAPKELSEGMSSNTTLCLICHSNVSILIHFRCLKSPCAHPTLLHAP